MRPGENPGFLGLNGAGETTTVRTMAGLIEPSEGQIYYQGRTVYDDFTAFQRRIGYVPEDAHLYPHLSGREYLQLPGRLRGIARRVLEPRMDEFLRLFDLWNDRHAPLASYATSMPKLRPGPRMSRPESALPGRATGLPPAHLAAHEKMMLYSSHVLAVVEKICSNVLILHKGEVAAYDSIDRLGELMSQPIARRRLRLRIAERGGNSRRNASTPSILLGLNCERHQ